MALLNVCELMRNIHIVLITFLLIHIGSGVTTGGDSSIRMMLFFKIVGLFILLLSFQIIFSFNKIRSLWKMTIALIYCALIPLDENSSPVFSELAVLMV